MKRMRKVNVIKKLVNYGLITLVGFNLFTGCVKLVPEYGESYDVDFQMNLPLDLNGYYHLTLDRSNWQTTHRVSGVVTTINEYGDKLFVEAFGLSGNLTYIGISVILWDILLLSI